VDGVFIAQLLRGNHRLTPSLSRGLAAVLEQAAADCERVISMNRDAERRILRHKDDELLRLAKEPGGLLLLQRYTTRLELSIQRKMGDLRQL
jgi:hypothetical protein